MAGTLFRVRIHILDYRRYRPDAGLNRRLQAMNPPGSGKNELSVMLKIGCSTVPKTGNPLRLKAG
jgi:hypothetical protein